MVNDVLLEIITPQEMFYSGRIEMIIVSTFDGKEGFLPNHTWCCKLLAEDGTVQIRETGKGTDLKKARIKSGYVDIKDHFVVYTDEAKWEE